MTTTATRPAAAKSPAKPAAKRTAAKAPAQKPDFKPADTGGGTVTDLLNKGAKPEAKQSAKAKAPAKPAVKKQPAKAGPERTADPALSARLAAVRTAGFTCRNLAALANPDVPLEPGSATWKLAGQIDRVSRGGTVFAADAAKLIPVLDGIDSGKVSPPERATRKPSVSTKAQAITALEAAIAEKSAADMRKLVTEALTLLGARQAAAMVSDNTSK
jgi:hypothetical protein